MQWMLVGSQASQPGLSRVLFTKSEQYWLQLCEHCKLAYACNKEAETRKKSTIKLSAPKWREHPLFPQPTGYNVIHSRPRYYHSSIILYSMEVPLLSSHCSSPDMEQLHA